MKVISGFANVPFLVVTNTTPLAARTPYIAAEPSLRIDILSISDGSICEKSAAIPSTIISAPPNPLISMEDASCPGSPLLCIALTPGRFPIRALVILETGDLVIISPFTEDTDPVRFTFF